MRQSLIVLCALALVAFGCKSDKKTSNTDDVKPKIDSTLVKTPKTTDEAPTIKINPIEHATMVLEGKNTVIYVDPVGGADVFKNQKPPNVILVTDIHGDHFNLETILAVIKKNTQIVIPKILAEKFPDSLKAQLDVISNGQNISLKTSKMNVAIEAIPMYNLREEALKFHEKGRGNGYVLTMDNKRIYISGDTEDIPEMRALKDIDIAFVCMNLPYTMTVESAASAVLDFKPKKVYPYHYRGTEGFSDVENFKSIINKENNTINVKLLNWYTE